jgi:hypothetical protein
MMLAALGVEDTSAQVLAAANAQTRKANSDLAVWVERLASEIRSLGLTPTVEKVSGKATLFEAVDYYIVGIAEYGEAASRIVPAGRLGTDPAGLARTMASDGRLAAASQQRAAQNTAATHTPVAVISHTESPSTQTTQQAVVAEAVTSAAEDSDGVSGFLQGNTLLLVGAVAVAFFLFGRSR